MSDKTKLSFALPANLKTEIREHVVKHNYGLRGKSRWISEAIENLLALNDFLELIHFSDEMQGFDKMETLLVPYALKLRLDNAILQVRQKYPILEGVQSRIIRTAILQRILRS